ncbi:MAG: hypothetical protein WBY53_02515 [Acidobacteriaceae bacterium]
MAFLSRCCACLRVAERLSGAAAPLALLPVFTETIQLAAAQITFLLPIAQGFADHFAGGGVLSGVYGRL